MAAYPVQLPVRNGSILPGTCFLSEQQRLNAFSSLQYVEIPANLAAVIVGPNEPTVEEQGFLWVRSDAFNNPVQQFLFSSQFALWVWPHPIAASDPRLQLYEGAAGDVWQLDGGDNGVISATTGAFWEIATEWTDKLPIGAGTVPVNDEALEFDDTAPDYPAVRGVYFVRRTIRQFITS